MQCSINEPGLIMFGAILNKTDSLDEARNTMLSTIEGVIKEPPSKEEVDRARTHIEKDLDMTLRDSERVGLFLSEYLAQGDWRLLFRDRDLLKKVTPEDVQRVAAAYLKTSNQTIGEFIPDPKPDRAEIPAKTDVAAALKDYKGEAAMSAGEAFDPSPKNIESRLQRYNLPSGMKVSLLQKKTRGASVHALITLRFGDLESLNGKDTVAGLAGASLIRGTTNKNRQQIQDEIDRLKAQLNVNGGASGATVNIETTHENLPAVLRLAGGDPEGSHPARNGIRRDPQRAVDSIGFRQERTAIAGLHRDQPHHVSLPQGRRARYPLHPRGNRRSESRQA